jgi:hypothetical protein
MVTAENILVAVSGSSDPRGNWAVYRFPTMNNEFRDQPSIGVSGEQFVITTNDYPDSTKMDHKDFKREEVFIADKADMVEFMDLQVYDYDLGNNFGLVPVREESISCYINNANPRDCSNGMELVSVHTVLGPCNADCSKIVYYSVFGTPKRPPYPGGAPGVLWRLPALCSPLRINIPPNAAQPGTNILLDTGDFRAHYGGMPAISWYSPIDLHGGSAYENALAFEDACTPNGDTQVRSCIRLFSYVPVYNPNTFAADCVVLLDEDISGPPGSYLFYPSLITDAQGGIDVAFGYSSSTAFPSLMLTALTTTGYVHCENTPGVGLGCTQGHGSQDCLMSNPCSPLMGQPTPFITIQSGTAAVTNTTGRYGDYFQSTLDSEFGYCCEFSGGEYESSTGWSTSISFILVRDPSTG